MSSVTSSDPGLPVLDTLTAGGKVDSMDPPQASRLGFEGLVGIVLPPGEGLLASEAAGVATGVSFAAIVFPMMRLPWKGLGTDGAGMRAVLGTGRPPGEDTAGRAPQGRSPLGHGLQVTASSCSLDISPGTMVIGIGSDPACRVSAATRGPGPLRPVAAPRTRTPISGSSRT